MRSEYTTSVFARNPQGQKGTSTPAAPHSYA